ncbi:precorrin-3B C(17)-methyltransferase [Synechococcus sp. CBW1107]|uniref:precorrin-3B C(17)-methyltransferase n=1 Tax=Synechococcus sp. CBW1107 TaxID=2789857 RepID=UPI0018CC97E9|nr:precorrin-3B C(17)-methyltransferase [Synechococcus sp. CBW1107]QPN55598.1 precorrin-3B C(17)-methyltransferase [Synechococcus sp. CBW1107]
MSDSICWGLALSRAGAPVLERLDQGGLLMARAEPGAGAAELLRRHWSGASAFVVVGACGAVTRLVAPLLQGKEHDPAVVVVDPQGRFAIPLLGGHGAGAEQLSQRVAALLGGEAVLTGASSGGGSLALDSFGLAWGWRRGLGDWSALMKAAARGELIAVRQESGCSDWQGLQAAATLLLPAAEPAEEHTSAERASMQLVISPRRGPGCRWHPPSLWLGLGCERDTSLSLLERLLEQALDGTQLASEAVAGLASIDRKGDEPALLELARRHQWPLRLFSAEALAVVPVPSPSEAVLREMGTASVAEAAALLASSPQPDLLLEKRIERARPGERGAATLAVAQAGGQWAPQRGRIHLVGSGPGRLDLLTPEARLALAESTVWVGYSLYLDLLEPLRRPDQLRRDGRLTEERDRCRLALELADAGLSVALVSSGDSGIYGMAGLALELWLERAPAERPAFSVHPGLSALQVAAARAGAPLMHDFCTISLSDRLTPWATIEKRLRAAASGDFVVALYNPRSLGRDWQLGRARELLLEGRSAETPVVLARQLGRAEESVHLHSLGDLPLDQVDMLSLVLVGNSTSRRQDGMMVTPRGYPGAELC